MRDHSNHEYEVLSLTRLDGKFSHFRVIVRVYSGPKEDVEVAEGVCAEDLGGLVVSTPVETRDIFNDVHCRSSVINVHAEQIGTQLKLSRSDIKRVKKDLRRSMDLQLEKLRVSVVLSVVHVGSRLISVGATPGLGIECCWWHASFWPMGYGDDESVARFTCDVGELEARTVEFADRYGFDAQLLLKHCEDAIEDLRARDAACGLETHPTVRRGGSIGSSQLH